MKLILPTTYIPEVNIKNPLFFLAGPVLGGDDWQQEACEILKVKITLFYVVNPCRYGPAHPLYKYKVDGDETTFERQTDWERYYLEIASRPGRGCIIFWLEVESKENPRNDGDSYARDSGGELGEWRGRLMNNLKLNVVIGADKNFPGLRVISINQNLALKTDFPIYKTLRETISRGVRKYRQTQIVTSE